MNVLDDPRLWLEQVLQQGLVSLRTFVPELLAALVLLLLGWLGASLLRWLIQRFGKGLDAVLNVVHRWLGQEVTRPRWSVSNWVANAAFWIILVYAVSAASQQLGMLTLASWLRELLGYLPRVLISAFTLFIGYLISGGVRNMIVAIAETNGFQHGASLGQLAAALILTFALLLGLGQLGLDVSLFSDMVLLVVAALLAGAALAFGLGAGDAVRNIMASHYVRKAYKVGQRVRLGALEGEILELNQVAVVLGTLEGEALIPARQFLEQVSLLLEEEEPGRA